MIAIIELHIQLHVCVCACMCVYAKTTSAIELNVEYNQVSLVTICFHILAMCPMKI